MTSKELIEKYPLIFQVRKGRELEPFSMFGIECGSGWFPLLDTLCYQIQSYIDYRVEFNKRIEENKKKYPDYDQTPFALIPQVVVTQVKEKFGTLRFYYDGGDETIDGMVRMAEAMSSITCNVCGNLGKMRGRHWFYTACEEHTRAEDKVLQENNDE
jgi:hypothetical protein